MGRGALLGWMGAGLLLLCACSRAPDRTPRNDSGQDAPAPVSPEERADAGGPVPPRDSTWDPISPAPFPDQTPTPDAGASDGGAAADGGSRVEIPTAEPFPQVTCGPAEPEPLAEVAAGTLFAASPGARVFVFAGLQEGMWVHHVPSGRVTRIDARWWVGFTPDERAVLFLGRSSGLLELDVATGAVRELISNPSLFVPRENSMRGFVLFYGAYGGAWAYSWRSGQVLNLVSEEQECTPSNMSVANDRILVRDSGAFVLWDEVSGQRWKTPPAKAARLLPDGTGMFYSDAEDRIWGWTPERGPVLLGQGPSTPRQCVLEYAGTQVAKTGDVLFVSIHGEATLWNPRTGAVRALGTDVMRGTVSASGTQLVLQRYTPQDAWSITVQSLPTGPERVLHRTEGRYGGAVLRLSKDGTRLAFSQLVPGSEDKRWDDQLHQVRLWNLETDREVVMSPLPKPLQRWNYTFEFREDSGLLSLSNWNTNDAMYSASTGARVFETTRGAVPGVGHYSYWGGNGVFYAPVYDHAGPPDLGLYAWNPRTGIETYLGRETSTACYVGERHLLLTGVPYPDSPTPGTLLFWTPATGRALTVATQVMSPDCEPGRGAATFFTDWRPGAWAGDTFTPDRATLHFVDLDRGCQQPLATEVEQSLPVDGGRVFHAKGKVWRVHLP